MKTACSISAIVMLLCICAFINAQQTPILPADTIVQNGTTLTLKTSLPMGYTGKWTVVKGNTIKISDPQSTEIQVTANNCTENQIRWSWVSIKDSSFANIAIVFYNFNSKLSLSKEKVITNGLFTDAIATSSYTAVNDRNAANINGNLPEGYVGEWSVVAGDNGNVGEKNNPSTFLYGQAGNLYVLEWKIKSACYENTAKTEVFFKPVMEENKNDTIAQ